MADTHSIADKMHLLSTLPKMYEDRPILSAGKM